MLIQIYETVYCLAVPGPPWVRAPGTVKGNLITRLGLFGSKASACLWYFAVWGTIDKLCTLCFWNQLCKVGSLNSLTTFLWFALVVAVSRTLHPDVDAVGEGDFHFDDCLKLSLGYQLGNSALKGPSWVTCLLKECVAGLQAIFVFMALKGAKRGTSVLHFRSSVL